MFDICQKLVYNKPRYNKFINNGNIPKYKRIKRMD